MLACGRGNPPAKLDSSLENEESVVIETVGVKVLTPSFLDELIPPLMVKHGKAKVLSLIEFKISVHNLFPGFSLDEVRRLFLYFDEDGNGKISVEEFVVGIKVSPLTKAICLATIDTVLE